MKTIHKPLASRIKDRLWVWRPILLFFITGFVVFIFVSEHAYKTGQLGALHGKGPTIRVALTVTSDAGVNNIVLTERAQLDSIDNAFKAAQEKDIQKGGAFETSANVTVYKGSKKIDVFIAHSVYNGWFIEVGGKMLVSDYLFALVRRYAKR